MTGIRWIASYPKSGNTWVRAFLRAFLDAEKPFMLLDLEGFAGAASDRKTFDYYLDVDSWMLREDEVQRHRRAAFATELACSREDLFIKVHDRWSSATFDFWAQGKSLYLVRDPRDVALSLCCYYAFDRAEAIAFLGNSGACLASVRGQISRHLKQVLGSWSDHVRSWLQAPGVLVLRYEDLLQDPVGQFGRLLDHFALSHGPAELERAIALSSFDRLQKQELAQGFREAPGQATPFFRKGRAGSWSDVLSAPEADGIVADHGEIMERFGYLCGRSTGRPIPSAPPATAAN